MQKERLKLLPFRKIHHPLPVLQPRKEERLKVQYGGGKGRLANTIAGGKDEAQEMLYLWQLSIYIYIGVCISLGKL